MANEIQTTDGVATAAYATEESEGSFRPGCHSAIDWTNRASRPTRRALLYILTFAALLVSLGLLRDATWQTGAQFHTLLEGLATTLSFAVGVVCLMRYYPRRENSMLFAGAGFLGTALLDGYHAVVTSSFFSEVLPSALNSLIPWSWVASRIFLSLFLFLSSVIWLHGKSTEWKMFTSPAYIYTATGVAVVASIAFFAFVPLPQAHYPDLFFHRPQELIPAALFFMAFIGYLRKGCWRHSTFEHWLVLSLIVGFMGQAMFMSFSGEIFDLDFGAAHTLKIVSYVFVLAGSFISISRLFQRAGVHSKNLAAQAVELEEARDTALKAVEARTQFLANVSHEIRTPMSAILGMTELALSTDLSVEQREYLGTTRTSVEALITIVNDLLDLSKIEAEKLELDSMPFSLRDTVSDTVRTLSFSATSKGVELAWEIADSIPDCVIGDPGRLRQVLVNLIGNAIKFTQEGQIRVVVELEHIGDDDVELRFDVQDTGIGIAPDKLEHIFEAFTQADGSTTREFGGTGLGLSISSQLVQLMGGTISAESTPGVGSSIHFTTRLALHDSAQTITSKPRTGDQPSVVMIVGAGNEHHSLVEMLTQGEIQPIIVTSVDAAATAVTNEMPGLAPCVLLVDDADESFERCRQIMNDETLGELSVIALVSVGGRGDAAQYRRLGMSGYLTKPVLQTDLLEAVRMFSDKDLANDTFVTVHSLREQRPRLRVLLADDSPTNRQLATRLLELRGHSIVTAEDGEQAVEAWQQGTFDVILMDVQMPVMDGLEATEVIRESETDDERIPIVALTAFATDSDMDRCLKAGMDSYISKPFRAEQLYASIERFSTDSSVSAGPQVGQEREGEGGGGTVSDPINRELALEIVGGSAELLAEVAAMFLEEYPALMCAIDDAFGADDLDSVMLASHRLKGSLGMLAALPAQSAAEKLEHQAGAGQMDQALDSWKGLATEMARLQPALTALASKDVSTTG